MRLLLADLPGHRGATPGSDLDDTALADLYAAQPREGSWVRANFATSIDGAITGPDGRSGSVNSESDHVVFSLLRAISDVVVVGAGTLRSEGYTALTVDERWRDARSGLGLAPTLPLVCVSNSGEVPETLHEAEPGRVLLATHAGSDGLAAARRVLGEEHVLVAGDERVDDRRLVRLLVDRGWRRVLTEGGPQLVSSMIAAGVLDELCLSLTPVVVGGDGPRLTTEAATVSAFSPRTLVEEDGTVMGRWVREDAATG